MFKQETLLIVACAAVIGALCGGRFGNADDCAVECLAITDFTTRQYAEDLTGEDYRITTGGDCNKLLWTRDNGQTYTSINQETGIKKKRHLTHTCEGLDSCFANGGVYGHLVCSAVTTTGSETSAVCYEACLDEPPDP